MFQKFLRRHGWRYLPGIVFLIVSAYIATLAPRYLGMAIDVLSQSTIDASLLKEKIVGILVVAFLVFVTRFTWRYFMVGNARYLECFLREELFMHYQNLSVSFFNHQRTGDLMAYAINDLGAIRMTFGPALNMFLSGMSMFIFSLSSMAGSVNPLLTLFCLLPIPCAVFIIFYIGGLVQKRFRRVQEMFASVSGRVQENIYGMRVLKAFAQEDAQIASFTKQSDQMREANMALTRASALLSPLTQVFFGVSYMISILYGGHLVQSKSISLGDFVAFQGYLTMIVFPILSLGRIVGIMQRGMASFKRLRALMETPPIPQEEEKDQPAPPDYRVEAKDLSFTYPSGSEPALSNISFSLAQGGVLGIVGPTGCGKSTLAHLLIKHYLAPEGQLFVGGMDVRDIPARALREGMGYVPQDDFLFSATLRENISFFQEGATQDVIEEAANLCGLTSDIEGFTKGYDTVVGERGVSLSGGQKQRVALARALVRNPKLLMLDDTFSALDNQTEKRVLENLTSALKGKTAIIVSHRLSAVEIADEILYLEKGSIVERGTHNQLLALGGAYAALYEKQRTEGGQEAS